MIEEIEGYDKNYILNASESDLCQYLISKYSYQIPTLHEGDPKVDDFSEVKTASRSLPYRQRGTRIVIAVPFDGDGDLLEYGATQFSTVHPAGEIVGQEIHLSYDVTEYDNPRELKHRYERDLMELKRHMEWTKHDLDNYNKSIETIIRETITERKKTLLAASGLVSALGIPIKRRDDLVKTYAIPSIRKKIVLAPPRVTARQYEPEPTLHEEDFGNILDSISNMSLVMERNPTTFLKLKEEEIRNIFLMLLNVYYEGQATGETFNYLGKTDILIRAGGKNVFIAECKFWRGDEALLKAIGQLLGYTSWRDTKTAILLFNKNQDFSSVLNKIRPVVESHPCYKRRYDLKFRRVEGETRFDYVFHQPNDKNRELFLVILAFNIPKPNKSPAEANTPR